MRNYTGPRQHRLSGNLRLRVPLHLIIAAVLAWLNDHSATDDFSLPVDHVRCWDTLLVVLFFREVVCVWIKNILVIRSVIIVINVNCFYFLSR